MSADADADQLEARRSGVAGRVLVLGAVACAVGAGALLWARTGDAIFNDVVVAAIAWCF